MDEAQYIQIEGTVASLIYHNAENGYTVLRLNTAEGVSLVVHAGRQPGESRAKGGWATHQSYGEQFGRIRRAADADGQGCHHSYQRRAP